MAQWGSEDNTANSVLWGPVYAGLPANTANRDALFQSTTVGVFKSGVAVGQFGVSPAEAANTAGEGKKVTHSGWNLRTVGTGPVVSFTISAAGSLYANTDTVQVVAGAGGANALGTIVTNGQGNVVSVALTSAGSGFTTPTVAGVITTSTGADAVVVANVGGRAGRVQYETLVATGSMNNGTADDALLPQ